MRIGFTGSQGTGKTVTNDALRKVDQFRYYYAPTSSARRLKTDGINTKASPLSQLVITTDRVNNIRKSIDVVTDRTAIDSWAYTKYQKENLWRLDTTLEDYYAVTDELVRQSMQDIDLLVYFPVYWKPKYDGVRSPVANYQSRIDTFIREGIEEFYQGPLMSMKNEPVDKRVSKIIKAVNELA